MGKQTPYKHSEITSNKERTESGRGKISLETVTEHTHMLLNNEFNFQASQKALSCLGSPLTFFLLPFPHPST